MSNKALEQRLAEVRSIGIPVAELPERPELLARTQEVLHAYAQLMLSKE